MILTDYYRFERVAQKAKHRMDCTASTESYPEFENRRATKAYRETEKRDAIRIGDLIIYWVVPDSHMRADRSITIKSDNLAAYIIGSVRVIIGLFMATSKALQTLCFSFIE